MTADAGRPITKLEGVVLGTGAKPNLVYFAAFPAWPAHQRSHAENSPSRRSTLIRRNLISKTVTPIQSCFQWLPAGILMNPLELFRQIKNKPENLLKLGKPY